MDGMGSAKSAKGAGQVKDADGQSLRVRDRVVSTADYDDVPHVGTVVAVHPGLVTVAHEDGCETVPKAKRNERTSAGFLWRKLDESRLSAPPCAAHGIPGLCLKCLKAAFATAAREAVKEALRPAYDAHQSHAEWQEDCPFCRGDIT
jgi:hypothetical protein